MLKFCILVAFIYINSVTNSFAYLDPGTGSIILQAIVGAIATLSVTIGIYWTRFKLMCKKFLSLFSKNQKK